MEKPLGHVPGIDHHQLERSLAASPRHAQPAQRHPPDHRARRAHDHDDAEPQPNGDARPGEWASAQDDERVVVSGLCPTRKPRRDEQLRGGMRGQPEARRSQPQPTCCRAQPAPLDDARPAEATVTATAFLPGFLSRTAATPLPLNTSRAGAAVNPSASGGLPAPAAQATSASATANGQRSARLIAR
jgi:hypothetical protein